MGLSGLHVGSTLEVEVRSVERWSPVDDLVCQFEVVKGGVIGVRPYDCRLHHMAAPRFVALNVSRLFTPLYFRPGRLVTDFCVSLQLTPVIDARRVGVAWLLGQLFDESRAASAFVC